MREWMMRIGGGKSLEEIIATLGPPVREHGPSDWTAHSPGLPAKVTHHPKSLEFAVVSANVKTVLIHLRDDGLLDYELRGRELAEAKS
jgi:hypothetical protein